MKIFFIRHGETTGDIENRYGGEYNDHLSEKGLEQSKNLANNLKGRDIEIIFSSSLIRAQETSQAIAKEVGCDVILEPSLKERNQYGILTGMKKEDAKTKYPKEVELLKDRLNTIEGAESYEDFSERIVQVFKKLTENSKYETMAFVSHGGPTRVLFRDILKWGELKEIGDCCFVELENHGDKWMYKKSNGLIFDFEPLLYN